MALTNAHRGWVGKTRRGARAVAAPIMQLPGVVCVTVGEKRRRGQRTQRPALIVYVVEKRRGVRGASRIPKTVEVDGETIETDVVELGTLPRTVGLRAGHLIFSADHDFGTATLTFRKNGVGYVVTCAHVVANLASGLVFQSSVQEAGTHKKLPLGSVPYISPIRDTVATREDIAFVRTGGLPVDEYGILFEASPIKRIGSFSEDLGAQYWYNSNGGRIVCANHEPQVAGVPVQMLVDNAVFLYADFYALEVQSGVVAGGHSGAVVCRGEGDEIVACGILFAAAPPNYAYVFPLRPVFTRVAATL